MIWGALQTLNEDACEDLREDQEVMAETEDAPATDGGEQGQYSVPPPTRGDSRVERRTGLH